MSEGIGFFEQLLALQKAQAAPAAEAGRILAEDPVKTAKYAAYLDPFSPIGTAAGVAEVFGYGPDPQNPGQFLPSSYQQFKEADSAGDVGLATLGVAGAIPLVGAPFRAIKALRQIDRLKKRDMQPPEVLEFLKENPEIEQRAKGGQTSADQAFYGEDIMRALEPSLKKGEFQESSLRNVLKSRIQEMREEGISVNDINQEMEKTAIDLKIPSPPRAFDDPSVEYVSTEYLLKNVARGNPTRYNVQEIDEFKAGNLGENPGTKQKFIEEGRPSLKEDIYNEGIKKPIEITVSKRDGVAVISEGNHRLRAAQELGITEVPIKIKVRNRDPYIDPEQSGYRGERPTEIDVSGLEEGDYSPTEIGFANRVTGPKPPPSIDVDERGMPQGSFAFDMDMSPDPDPKTFTPMRPEFKKFETGGEVAPLPPEKLQFVEDAKARVEEARVAGGRVPVSPSAKKRHPSGTYFDAYTFFQDVPEVAPMLNEILDQDKDVSEYLFFGDRGQDYVPTQLPRRRSRLRGRVTFPTFAAPSGGIRPIKPEQFDQTSPDQVYLIPDPMSEDRDPADPGPAFSGAGYVTRIDDMKTAAHEIMHLSFRRPKPEDPEYKNVVTGKSFADAPITSDQHIYIDFVFDNDLVDRPEAYIEKFGEENYRAELANLIVRRTVPTRERYSDVFRSLKEKPLQELLPLAKEQAKNAPYFERLITERTKRFASGGIVSLAPIARNMFRGPRALESLAPVARNMDRSMLRSG